MVSGQDVGWWNAWQLLPTTPETLQDATAVAQGWLDEASARVSAPKVPPPVPRGRLLLLYRFQRRSAKAIRIGFFVMLGFMILFSLTIVATVLTGGSDLGSQVFSLVLFGILTLSLRFWAVSANSTGQK